MLKNEQIIYIGNDWFSENKTSSHHIAETLAEHNQVLYIEAAGQRAPRASGRDFKKILNKLKKAWKDPVGVADNVSLYSPLILPFHKYKLARVLNRVMLRMMMKRACRHVGFKSPILWILMPHYSSLVGTIEAKGVVYYCVDEYSSQPNTDAAMIKEMEGRVLDKADVVFAVSSNLVESKRKHNQNTHLSLHGVDVEHFEKSLDEATEIPADIAGIKRPIAGFFGLIEEWIDLEMIHYLAAERPAVSFVLIGRVAQDASRLEGLSNVHFLGQRPYQTLPSYLKAFDACLLPYKMNTQVINSNPKKLREYMAGGKPIVSVPVREVLRYKDMVYIAENYEQYADCIDRALTETGRELADTRLAAAREESWPAKVDRISGIVEQSIPGVNNE